MMPSDLQKQLVEPLEGMIWSLPHDQLAAGESALLALFNAVCGGVSALFGELADETLVLAIQKEFLRNYAFEECLVNRYEKLLLNYFCQQTNNIDLAQDLIQGLYVKLLVGKTLSKYDPERPFSSWLWIVARNFLVGQLRQRPREFTDGDEQLAKPINGKPLLSPVEEASFHEFESQVDTIVQQLPQPQQFVLRESMNNRRADEIAEELGISKPQVYRLLFNARRKVERTLRPPSGQKGRMESNVVTPFSLEEKQ